MVTGDPSADLCPLPRALSFGRQRRVAVEANHNACNARRVDIAMALEMNRAFGIDTPAACEERVG